MKMWTRMSVLNFVVAGVLLLGLTAQDAQAQKAKPKKMKDRVADLETMIERIDSELNKLVGEDKPEEIQKKREVLEEKLDSLAEELAEIKATMEETAAAAEEKEARLNAASDEIAALWDENEAQAEKIEELTKFELVGYDKGFFMKSRDGKHKLVLNGFVKPFWRMGIQKVWAYTEDGKASGGDAEVVSNTMGLAATRFQFAATVFENVNFKMEIDYGTPRGSVSYPANSSVYRAAGDAGVNRVSVSTHYLRTLGAWGEFAPMSELKLRAGQFKVPFDRESLNPTGGLLFTGRSLMTRSYKRWGEFGLPVESLAYGWDYETQRASSFGYDTGFMVHGCISEGMFNYAAGVFNGNGNNTNNNNRDMAVAVRLSSDFLGKMTGGMSDLDTLENPLLSVGAGFVWDLPVHVDPVDVGRTYNSSDINVSGDVQFKWQGVSLLTSVFFRNADHGAVYTDIETGDEMPIKSFGYMGQLAYYNAFTGLEPAFRYSMYDAETDRDLDHMHEFTAGLNYYLYGNNLKVQLEWRGLFAAEKTQSYLAPWGSWTEDMHELTLMVQAGF